MQLEGKASCIEPFRSWSLFNFSLIVSGVSDIMHVPKPASYKGIEPVPLVLTLFVF